MKRILMVSCALVACFASSAEIHINEGAFENRSRVEHRDVKLKKFFGINEELLANTKRFPVSSNHWYDFDLPEDIGGFKTVRFSLKDEGGKFGIFNVEMKKELPAEADDNDLRREFKSAVDMVGKALGFELKCPELKDVDEWRREGRTIGLIGFDTDVRIELAGDYNINIEARDAVYVKRDGEMRLVSNATLEIEIRNDKSGRQLGRRMRGKKDTPVAIAREVEFGIDLSEQLSTAMKEEAAERNSKGKEKSERHIRKMIKEAESGDVRAMSMLAWHYQFGHDVKADQKLAFKYSKMAADTGDAHGIAKLACCYEEGRGTKKDVVKAATLWKQSAEMGNAWAVSRYAKCLAEGIGVEQDPEEAARLFTMCASSRRAASWTIIQIASFYLRGFGVEKDEAKAREWLDKLEAKAADNEPSDALGLLCKFYLDGEKGVGKDADRAFKMAQLAEETDTAWGYKYIARCYKDGIGVEKDITKAKEYVEMALKKCKGGNCNLEELKKMQKELEGLK